MSSLKWGNSELELEFGIASTRPVVIRSVTMLSAARHSTSAIGETIDANTNLGAGGGNESTETKVVFERPMPVVELMAAQRGSGHTKCSRRLIETSLGASLRYTGAVKKHTDDADMLTISMDSELGLAVNLSFELPAGCTMMRVTAEVTNTIDAPLVLESLAVCCLPFGVRAHSGGEKSTDLLDGWALTECAADWLGEGRWATNPMRRLCPALGNDLVGRNPQGAHSVVSEGTFSTGTSMPMGIVSNQGEGIAWLFQVEHNGAWRWEVGEREDKEGYLALSGPTYRDHGWSTTLMKGCSFTSVPVSVALGHNVDDVIASVTRYRRMEHSALDEIGRPGIIFNDYMNTLNGDPTRDKLMPLVEAAAQVGAEVFCIDAGWYDDTGDWWPSVGEWMPSSKRFPNGLSEVTDAIRERGMVPGLWMEPEVIGVKSPLAAELPDEAFFLHAGQRVVEQERYLLDFRNPVVIERMNGVVDRLIKQFGVGYFKFDYNVMPGPGTTYKADSPGDGLLGHNRAYSAWIQGLHRRHPNLILENCSSGGMREDFAQTALFRLNSTSDQQDFRKYPTITATAPLAMLPEQAGNWAYPSAEMDDEEFVFALVNTMPGHFFMSGYLNRFSDRQIELVKVAVAAYRESIQPVITQAVPFWPLGLPQWEDKSVALGLDCGGGRALLTVWARCCEEGRLSVPLPKWRGKACEVRPVFPAFDTRESGMQAWSCNWDEEGGELKLELPKGIYTARIYEISVR
ncbi:alpha-galactosidase [Bifidobacterium actinocoloniiforme DSM 22766]|uniref:Alpha-galactosidase n=2 Tax=Bifidobacterium actinocoloniiforme TaxID=638619 RepID=A0A086YYA2_9BIFI|nr:glycoside hydrolase family 36 protein [Bifidobacterium actinocoloniiforme]KFI39252.1 alpha-galactosidase [Bifidobacterium actinocoloniiforme DSM 22766]